MLPTQRCQIRRLHHQPFCKASYEPNTNRQQWMIMWAWECGRSQEGRYDFQRNSIRSRFKLKEWTWRLMAARGFWTLGRCCGGIAHICTSFVDYRNPWIQANSMGFWYGWLRSYIRPPIEIHVYWCGFHPWISSSSYSLIIIVSLCNVNLSL